MNRTAADTTEFINALNASSGGDTIELTGTNYTAFQLTNVYSSTVTIFGTDPVNPPLISGRLHLKNCSRLRFDDIHFDRPYVNGDGNQVNTIEVDGASYLHFENCEVMGGTRTSDGAHNGRGFAGANCIDLTCVNVKFHKLFKGYTGNATPARFSYCEFTNIRSDGQTLGGSNDLLVEYCYYHDFQQVFGSGAHPDMCQIQRTSGIGTQRFTFRYNVMDIGDGNFCQGLFSGESGRVNTGTGTVVRHVDWEIYGNLIQVDHANDMTFTWVDGLNVYDNATIRIEANNNSGTQSSIDCLDCTATTITNNIAGGWATGPGITATGNVQVLIADWPSQFNTIASTSLTNPAFDDSYHDFEIKAGGTVHTAGIGPRIMKREGDWGGQGINPHPAYPGGCGGTSPPPPSTVNIIQVGGQPLIMGGQVVKMG